MVLMNLASKNEQMLTQKRERGFQAGRMQFGTSKPR